jgi:hypothetical protein
VEFPYEFAGPLASAHDAADFQATDDAFSLKDNSIAVLQRRTS